MFKINDIVKLNDNYNRVTYPADLISVEQSYIVEKVVNERITIRGLENNQRFTISKGYYEIDLELTRKFKLQKICSKLETL